VQASPAYCWIAQAPLAHGHLAQRYVITCPGAACAGVVACPGALSIAHEDCNPRVRCLHKALTVLYTHRSYGTVLHRTVLYRTRLAPAAGLAPVVLKLLQAKKPLTIFAPTDEAFRQLHPPHLLREDSANTTKSALKTTVLLHIVFGAYKNAVLVDLDFATQVQSSTGCTVTIQLQPYYVCSCTVERSTVRIQVLYCGWLRTDSRCSLCS